jgi:hypothetical protein
MVGGVVGALGVRGKAKAESRDNPRSNDWANMLEQSSLLSLVLRVRILSTHYVLKHATIYHRPDHLGTSRAKAVVAV